MINLKRAATKIAIVIVMVMVATSCTYTQLSKASRDMQIVDITKVEIKGMSGLMVEVILRNDSKYMVTMEEATLALSLDGKAAANVSLVKSVESPAMSRERIKLLWRIESVKSAAIFSLGSKLSQRDLSGISIDINASLSTGGKPRTISRKNVDIEKLMTSLAY